MKYKNVGRGFYSRRVKPTARQPTLEYIGREGEDCKFVASLQRAVKKGREGEDNKFVASKLRVLKNKKAEAIALAFLVICADIKL